MKSSKALRILRREGFDIEMTQDGHVFIRDEDGLIIGKMRQTGEAHVSLTKWIAAGFPKRPPSSDKYMKLLLPFGTDEELLFWTDEDIPTAEEASTDE